MKKKRRKRMPNEKKDFIVVEYMVQDCPILGKKIVKHYI